MNVLEVMRLFGECGFEFLPETDLQRRPGLEVVMTVGLHLCALEMTDQQVDTLACMDSYLNSSAFGMELCG